MASILHKTVVEIWTDFNPSLMEIDALAARAMVGDAICTKQETSRVPAEDESVPEAVISFFGLLDNEEDSYDDE